MITLPQNVQGQSPQEALVHMTNLEGQASELAKKFNRMARKVNPDQPSDEFDSSDFIKDNEIYIPKAAQDYEDLANREMEARQSAPPKEELTDEEKEWEAQGSIPVEERESKPKRHPVLSKLRKKFGLYDEVENTRPQYFDRDIGGMKFKFRQINSSLLDMAGFLARDISVSDVQVQRNTRLALVSALIVGIDDVPVWEIFELPVPRNPKTNEIMFSDKYDLPTKALTFATLRMFDFLMKEVEPALVDRLMEVLDYEYPGADYIITSYLDEDIYRTWVCPKCDKVEASPVEVFCRHDGHKMTLLEDSKQSKSLPLA